MALNSNSSESSDRMDRVEEEETEDSPTSLKLKSTTPHRSGTMDTSVTSDMDSMFGERESTLASTLDGVDIPDEYHRDPGEVNIHQFYPILDHTFNRNQTAKSSGTDKEMLLAIVEEDSPSEQTGSLEGTAEQVSLGQPDLVDDGEKDEGGDHDISGGTRTITQGTDFGTNLSEYSSTGQETSTGADQDQQGVFSTAVDEETLAAARERGQSLFSTENWQGGARPRRIGLVQIVTDRAYEHYQRALQLKEEGNELGIVVCLNKAINLKGDDPMFYVERAEAYIRLCDIQSSILNYKKACLLEPRNQDYFSRLAFLFYFHGQVLFDQRLYPEALESFSRASEMVPDNVGYHIRSITCLAALQRHGECLALVNKRLETDHDNPDLYIMRARLHEMFRNTTLCYYDIKDALVLDPDHSEGQAMMDTVIKRANNNKLQAMQLNIAGKHREALQKISIAIESNPSVADYHVVRGALHRKLNDFNAAIDDFLLALDKCDHNEEDPVYLNSQRQLLLTYNDFAVECFQKGFYEEAIILLNKAIKGEKEEKSLYVNRGDCFFKQGELNFALLDYHQALELDGLDTAIKARISVIHNEFGVSLYQDKNYTDAEVKFTSAIQYNPQVGQYYISRSRTRYMMENMTGAREDLLIGLLLAPTNEDVMSILSRLFPGKSVSDVVHSPAAQVAQQKLNNLVATNSPVKLRPMRYSASMLGTDYESDLCTQSQDGSTAPWAPTEASSGYTMCIQEKELYLQQVQEKKKVEHEVKAALNNRKSLRYEGARIQPLPPPVPKTRYGTYQGQRAILATTGGKKKSKSTNWRTFSVGLGGLQNV